MTLEADDGQHDIRMINEIWLDEAYGSFGFRPRDAWHVIDLGANKGFFSAWALHEANVGRLAAYEPDPANFASLERNLAQFRASPELHAAAVGARPGKVTLHRLAGRSGQASLDQRRALSRGKIIDELEVAQISFSEIVEGFERVDLLKVDVEGSEYEIIMNSSRTAFEKVLRIVLEADLSDPIVPGRTRSHLLAWIESLGFDLVGVGSSLHFFQRHR